MNLFENCEYLSTMIGAINSFMDSIININDTVMASDEENKDKFRYCLVRTWIISSEMNFFGPLYKDTSECGKYYNRSVKALIRGCGNELAKYVSDGMTEDDLYDFNSKLFTKTDELLNELRRKLKTLNDELNKTFNELPAYKKKRFIKEGIKAGFIEIHVPEKDE